mmetsp:Transcript_9202/g.26287  ORF Transcript_9202/g.26287 Transcript_9202/m.26287 type:complete len:658 (-) Transcript_9202:185-2158(-)
MILHPAIKSSSSLLLSVFCLLEQTSDHFVMGSIGRLRNHKDMRMAPEHFVANANMVHRHHRQAQVFNIFNEEERAAQYGIGNPHRADDLLEDHDFGAELSNLELSMTSPPTAQATEMPSTESPSEAPSSAPVVAGATASPTTSSHPTQAPSSAPSVSAAPSAAPSPGPSESGSQRPSVSMFPSGSPTLSSAPSREPTVSSQPSMAPSVSQQPSEMPSLSMEPSVSPSVSNDPTVPSEPLITPDPTDAPSSVPTTSFPTLAPTVPATDLPTIAPVAQATPFPSQVPSEPPTSSPTQIPSSRPTVSAFPSSSPSASPTTSSMPSLLPSSSPTTSQAPSGSPTSSPTESQAPTDQPTLADCALSPDQREAEIIRQLLEVVDDPVLLTDISTPQGQATEWILRLDPRQVCPIDPSVKIVQRWSLAVMYFSTNGDSWKACSANDTDESCGATSPFIGQKRFLGESNECEWAGIACNVVGCVTEVLFEDNDLIGTIPTEMGLLTDLILWGMERGGLTGRIPSQIGELPNLIFLDLDFNSLTGALPIELFTLSGMTQLDLNNNALTGNVDGFVVTNTTTGVDRIAFPVLDFLQLHTNQFTGTIPDLFGDLNLLGTFTLHDNNFTGSIPQTVCDLVAPQGPLTSLIADCDPPTPEVNCTCCTDCR